MLTLARPTSKVDEDIFSKWVVLSIIIITNIMIMMIMMNMFRLVELDKLRLATRKEEEAAIAAKGGIDPFYIG